MSSTGLVLQDLHDLLRSHIDVEWLEDQGIVERSIGF